MDSTWIKIVIFVVISALFWWGRRKGLWSGSESEIEQEEYPVSEEGFSLRILRKFHTVTGSILSRPTRFFKVECAGFSLAESLTYGVAIFILSVLASVTRNVLVSAMGFDAQPVLQGASWDGLVIGLGILFPIIALANIFFLAGIYHLILSMLGWSTQSFSSTVKIIAFTGASGLANILPLLGGVINFLWAIVLVSIGIKELHNTSKHQAVSVAITPMFLVACILFIGFF